MKEPDNQVFEEMPQRDSTSREPPTASLRRSPRLLPNDRASPQDPKTPEPKSRTNRVPHSDPPSLNSAQKGSLKKTWKHCPEDVSKKVDESEFQSNISEKSNTGSRRSAVFNGGGCLRRSSRFCGNGVTSNGFIEKTNKEGLSDASKPEVARVTRSSSRRNTNEGVGKIRDDNCNEFIESASTEDSDKEVISDVERAKVGANSCKRRKRNRVEEGHGIVQGWTKDQELALQRAYFSAVPTPHFWKKVAKLVPGKSAKDCFDKVHSDQLTPPQPRTRSRISNTNSSFFSLSASTLPKSSKLKTKRPSGRKLKSHLAQKTVRQLLQKHYNVDQNFEADLFSVLESTFDTSTQDFPQGEIFSTPTLEKEKHGYLKKCLERSFSASKKHISRLSSSYGATLVSPPVLKQVKDKALHEKYIDQLHCRETKRKAASARAVKSIPGKDDTKESYVQKVDVIKAAKNALTFDANDVINQFQHLKSSTTSNFSDFDDDCVDGDDN